MRNIQDDTKIAGSYTVSDWKKLRQEILEKNKNESLDLLKEAFEIFRTRVKTRFLDPIDAIIGMQKYEGEGFSAVALQCILVEFFESFYQGKVYVAPKSDEEISNQAHKLKVNDDVLKSHLQPNEYRSSSKLFKDFLMKHKPFSESFTSQDLTSRFYSNIRCGLLHEAATKGSSKIRNRKGNLLIEEIPFSRKNIILYRTNFQEALKNYSVPI
ncbi:hypothetical protein [Thermoleptolyngbya sp.]